MKFNLAVKILEALSKNPGVSASITMSTYDVDAGETHATITTNENTNLGEIFSAIINNADMFIDHDERHPDDPIEPLFGNVEINITRSSKRNNVYEIY